MWKNWDVRNKKNIQKEYDASRNQFEKICMLQYLKIVA
jgi:hypothetical protein